MKRLVRSQTDRMLSGLLGGIAEYLNVDPTVVRLLYVFLTIFTGIFPGIIAYVIALLVVPKE
ncbi:Phage shock protein C, PspC [[Clostridium] ultunense Esp]|uniref:PspC domain-containing protein n=1 Tax=Thermicanus aegyptius TaxID=94009 RepID=UPI0002B6FE4B|nr:PspC domain-containing protein [Thermicanus aegyptius]CCQ96852.1 Phage shock protein C, PspC [[Clostridium] ultunense Esp]